MLANQLAMLVAVACIFLSQWDEGVHSHRTLLAWIVTAAILWIFRGVLYWKLIKMVPSRIATNVMIRSLPLLTTLAFSVFWATTSYLFVGPTVNSALLVLFAAYVLMSVPTAAMSLTVPLASIAFLVVAWGSLLIRVWQLNLFSPLHSVLLGALVVPMAAIAVLLANQVRWHLNRSDRVDLLVADLKATRDSIKTALEKRTRFFALANHDFRQHLHGLKLAAGTALVAVPESMPETQSMRRSILRLNEHVEALDQYVTNILDFARIDTLREEPTLANVSLQGIFQEIAVTLDDMALEADCTLTLRPTRVQILSDHSMLLRLLENLIANAIKFTEGNVLVAARWRQGHLVIQVWDQGPGISQGQQAAIFDAFHRIESRESGESPKPGIGLGLAVAQRFSDAMGYRIGVRSRLGKGSVFELTIPGAAVLKAQ